MKKVSIITINYNQLEVTLELLDSVEKQEFDDLEIIVVDNGSQADPSQEISRKFPHVITIRSEQNLGFAGGNNLGISHASGEYLFFVNNDTEIPQGTIASLCDVLDQRSEAGIVCPVIYYYNNPSVVQYAGYTPLNFLTGRNQAVGHMKQMPLALKVDETSYAHGAAMMVRKEAIEAAGAMPENYFLYYEELDWATRIKEAGYKILVNRGCSILHKESMSVGKLSNLKTYFQTRNRILFMRRNVRGWRKLAFLLFFAFVAFPKNTFSYLISGSFGRFKAFLSGALWNVTHGTRSHQLGGGYDSLLSNSQARPLGTGVKRALSSAAMLLLINFGLFSQQAPLESTSIDREVFKISKLLNNPETIDSLVNRVYANSGLIRSLDHEVSMYEEEMLQKSRNWVSAFRLGVNVFSTNTTLGTENQSVTTTSLLPNLGLTLSVDPATFVNRKSEIRLSTSKRNRVSSLQDDHRQRLKIEIIKLYYEYLSVLESLAIKQNTLDTRKQHALVMEVEFKNGTTTYDQLLVVQNQVHLMEEDIVKARIEALKKKSEIEVLLGLK
ncbi:glycosyltransferase [Ekhidna sp.]|uniref:glycosyltransferase n=1 Tax=Ekhidna sp. TaxID=2608089 RepID=UPI003CCB8DB8